MKNHKAVYLGLVLLGTAYAFFKPTVSISQSPPRTVTDTQPVPVAPLTVTCSPDKPTVWPRETIHVRAWTGSGNLQPQYTWRATGGRIDMHTAEASWDFTDVQPNTYTATVRVTQADGSFADCSVQVIVQPRSHIRGRETGWSFLVSGRSEEKGYGLYSYVLLGSPPSDTGRERYRKAVQAYLALIPDIASLEQYIPRRELNVTYLPLKTSPPEGPVSPDWVLEHYDYARARLLLSKLPGDHRDGPYLVSSLEPRTEATATSGRHLLQDLSRTPPHLVSLWAKEFFNQAAQERFWEERTAQLLALKLRTTIGVLAIGLPDVLNALDTWIGWSR